MNTVAFRLPGLLAHNYGNGDLVLWDTREPFSPHRVRVSAKKLKRKLKKFLKECK